MNDIIPEEVRQVQREPHPFISKAQMPQFFAKTVAFIGKFVRADADNTLVFKTHEGKCQAVLIDKGNEVRIIKFRGDGSELEVDMAYEVRGIVNKDNSISYGELTKLDAGFDLEAYEQMLGFYHGMCKSLCVK